MDKQHWRACICSTLMFISSAASGQTCGWMPMGAGTGYATDCAVTPGGDLIAGLRIDFAGGDVVGFLAQWDGLAWSSVGGGVNDQIRAVEFDPDGDLLVGGWFTQAVGGLVTNGIARWDGAAWHAMGDTPGVRFGTVEAILPLGDGRLIAAGGFLQAGGEAAGRVALWDGLVWQAMGGLHTGDQPSTVVIVRALAQLTDGSIVAGGNFLRADVNTVVDRIARWDGFAWQPMAGGMSSAGASVVQALLVLPNGDLIAGGAFSHAGGVPVNRIARWDGVAWHPLGSGVSGLNGNSVYALALTPEGDVLVGGVFDTAGGVPALNVAKWSPNTGQWSALGSGISAGNLPYVSGLAASSQAYFAAGQFQDSNGSPTLPRNVAQYRLDISPPLVNPQPDTEVTACIGATIVLTAGGEGDGPFSFQWQRLAAPGLWVDLEDRVIPNWGTFTGTRTPTLTIANVASDLPQTLRVLVSNACMATPSDSVNITVAPSCDGDIDGDGDVDFGDLAILLAAYGTCVGDAGYEPAADIDNSGCVGFSDLATLLANYGTP